MTEQPPATGVPESERRTGDAPAALAIGAAGAVVATVSCFLPWVRLDLGRFAVFFGTPSNAISASATRIGVPGSIAVAGSIAMLLCVAGLLVGSRPSLRTACAWILAGAGVAVAAAAIMALAMKGAAADHVLRAAWQAGAGRALPASQFDRLRDVLVRLGSTSSMGLGLYLALLGGALGTAGGVLTVMSSMRVARERRAAGYARGFDLAGPQPPR